ncbi:tetratricopeptide repeat protein 37-like [Mya arenaria]|uniref:tetratricopeptide repeat protein 37-like n=1 Tax=Mya arenaria TaxID=6604 RepID=UPI0022E768CB|nr:tetratricopeptide repeat protein 37-like [Mya arenaria]XP_052801086.1 tetratricopeptide repeat protein 37-like [Mya arenaria]XP_052801087.1 tetratricopeptide repeat protein 37-like [Mya arenaria]XP_052801088.1 tetratricopeptide repeat protein 37-like [Mya arenaria]
MDAKEVKSALKKAREAIRQKEYNEALGVCKDIIASDGSNYMAFVLTAVAAEGLSQNDQALGAYRRAVQIDDTQILAWQGLGTFYEKNSIPAYASDQCDVYLKLIEFNKGQEDKIYELTVKLVKLTEYVNDPAKIQKILELSGEYLASHPMYSDEVETILTFFFSQTLQRDGDSISKLAQTYLQVYPASSVVLKHSILGCLDKMIVDETVATKLPDLVLRYEAVLGGCNCDVMTVAKAAISFTRKDCTSARKILQQLSSSGGQLVCVVCLQAKMEFELHQYISAIRTCKTAMDLVNRKDAILTQLCGSVRQVINVLTVRSLTQIGDTASLNRALGIIEKDLEHSESTQLMKGQICFKLGDLQTARSCLIGNSTEKQDLEGQIFFAEKDFKAAKQMFESLLKQETDNSSHLVNLAKCLWETGEDNQQYFTLLLKAAKLDPNNSVTFLYLGHYYIQVGKDKLRARKCYQKAFDLDPSCSEAGEPLCDFLTEQGEEDLVHQILVKFTSMAPPGSGKWAWLRLGLWQMKHGDPSVAIASLQSALRADSKDTHVWECLGEAYLLRGSYTASLKAFTRAAELNPASIYCLFQIASIKQTLGQYQEALEEYKMILDQSDDYVPALKGLGETLVQIGRSLLNQCFYGRARDTAELAVKHLYRAGRLRPDVSCLWKLIGDACTIIHVLPEKGFRFERPEKGNMTKLETLEFGNICYIRALKILPDCSSLWHDLGVNYIHQSDSSSGDTAISLAEKSVQSLKKAIQLEPTNHKHWNALGFVACRKVYNKSSLAQHCFIKSIKVEANNVVAWTNLAALYLKKENVKLAHEAFKVAQSLEPSYVACWVGQAIIAEVVGHEDAMDLFRHTTELSHHVEGAIGYGQWVCSVLLQSDKKGTSMYMYAIEEMGAVPSASDALARYTECNQTNPVAYNLHALLLERQGLYKTAITQLNRALLLCKSGQENAEILRDVLANCARCYRKNGDYPMACQLYKKLGEQSRVEDLYQFGLALYQGGDCKGAIQVYSQAAELETTDKEKSHILVTMAMVYYKMNDLNQTKTILFQSSQSSEASPAGLKALCALGLLQSDITLATAAVQELSKLGGENSHLYDFTLLQCILNLAQDETDTALALVQASLEDSTTQGDCWYLLTLLLLMFYPSKSGIATQAARNVLLHGHTVHNKKEQLLVPVADIKHGYHGNKTSCRNAFLSAQRAVHLYPDKKEGWLTLTSAVGVEAASAMDDERRRSLMTFRYNMLVNVVQLDLDPVFSLWCLQQRVACAALAGLHKEVMDDLDKLMTDYGEEKEATDFFNLMRKYLAENP